MTQQERFYIDHGMIHDRETGKHVTTDEDSVFCDGRIACCELLNALQSERGSRDRRIAELEALLGKAATALESRSMYEREGEAHVCLRCSICDEPDDAELGPQHTESCFISKCRSALTPGEKS